MRQSAARINSFRGAPRPPLFFTLCCGRSLRSSLSPTEKENTREKERKRKEKGYEKNQPTCQPTIFQSLTFILSLFHICLLFQLQSSIKKDKRNRKRVCVGERSKKRKKDREREQKKRKKNRGEEKEF